jgi:glycopeptide antibiotics resistance protein
MLGFWRSFGDLLPLGLACAAGLAVLLVVWRRLGLTGRRRLALAFLGVWALGLAAVTLLPASGSGWLDAHGHFKTRGFNLAPFSEIGDAITNSVTWRVPVEQIVGNLILFAPLGVGLAMLVSSRATRWSLGFVVGLAAGLVVELLQWVLNAGRISSTDDVLLAMVGCGLAFMISRPMFRSGRAGLREAREDPHREVTTQI